MIISFRLATRFTVVATALCGVCALGLSIAAWYFQGQQTEPSSGLVIAETQRDVGTLVCGEEHIGKFRVVNPCPQPQRILGSTSCCIANGCFWPVNSEQIIVPANGELAFACTINLHEVGPFEIPMAIYLEDKGVSEVILTVRGNGISSGASAK